jgi:AraC-like DNA-binding protein
MNRDSSVLASVTNAFLRFAADKVDTRHLLRKMGIEEQLLTRSDSRIPRRADFALWNEVQRITGDPHIGMTFGESVSSASAFGVVGFLSMASSNVGECLQRVAEFHSLVKDDWTSRLVRLERGTALQLMPMHDSLDLRLQNYGFVAVLSLIRRWTGESLTPRLVCVRHTRPANTSKHDRIFQCPVRFEQPFDLLVFDQDVLEMPLRTAQPDLGAYLEQQARAMMGQKPSDLVSLVRAAILEELPSGHASVSCVAGRLGMSIRTLHRRLEEHGLVYEEVANEMRRAQAIPLVVDSELPLKAISEQLGYSDTKAFRRAFRRWTGMAPVEARHGHTGAGAKPSAARLSAQPSRSLASPK